MARKGKIARLSSDIREALNRRLLDGQSGTKVLTWLNELPETRLVMTEMFDGLPVSDQNLSEWRKGGFAEWLARRDRIANTKELAAFSLDIAKAGKGTISEGAAAIAAGKVMAVLEGISEEDGKPVDAETLESITNMIATLRTGDQNNERLKQNAEKLRLTTIRLDQTAGLLELERQKFRRTTCELFLKWRDDDRAKSIADGPGNAEEKIQQLGQEMFGDLWETK